MAEYPIAMCACTFSFILFIVIIAVVTGMAVISTGSNYDWIVANSEESQNNDALDQAITQVDTVGATAGVRTEVYDEKMFYLFKSADGGDLYTASNLLEMCNVESSIALDAKFVDYCRLVDGECELPATSVVVYFYDFANLTDWNCHLLNSTVVDAKKDAIYSVMHTSAGQEEYGFWLDKGAPSRGYSTQAESVWYLGAP
eukprot:CAMPEP_0181328570 /NCGR_PEP_ID=MMETSP1101-20121128/22800_1 /TAXON_ID=46948 /ORGANISM="Rhodomonas abbreviata, Strain Caron Lab Isolate" /LENGTH=199 /DNA_ID=CAMNT_0023437495 /DNA_START=36 /DNA_END=631 /DNA_ORIENTATION=+